MPTQVFILRYDDKQTVMKLNTAVQVQAKKTRNHPNLANKHTPSNSKPALKERIGWNTLGAERKDPRPP